MDPLRLAADLGSTSDATFYVALGGVGRLSPEDAAECLAAVFLVLEGNVALSELRKSERVTALLRAVTLQSEGWEQLVGLVRTLSPGLRNALARHLPPARRKALSSTVYNETSSVPIPVSGSPDRSNRNAVPHLHDPEPSEYATVAILSHPSLQDANRALLKGKQFGVAIWGEFEQLRQDLLASTDVCAFLLDSSSLRMLDDAGQRELIRTVAEYSSFSWIRISQDGLRLSALEVERIIKEARGNDQNVTLRSLSLQPSSSLIESDLVYIECARDSLRAHHSITIVPGEISDQEGRLLIAASRAYADELHFGSNVSISSLKTRFLGNGLSGASTALIHLRKDSTPVVAKIDAKDRILEEILRFRTFIQPWDDQLHPRVHLHGESAVILFTLVRAQAGSPAPAPVLAQSLEHLWNQEVFNPADAGITDVEQSLCRAVRSVASLLADLNGRKPVTTKFSPVADPGNDSQIRSLEQRGIDWGLGSTHQQARSAAIASFTRLRHEAVVHGDFHLKNVLVRASDDVHLIDYAATGPGHPAVDLVRLELALFLAVARQVASEDACADFQRALSCEFLSETELIERFPKWHSCRINRVVTAGCVAARDQAIKVLNKHGGDTLDYIAAKYLSAWQSLLATDRQTSLARSLLVALEPTLSTRSARQDEQLRAVPLGLDGSAGQKVSLLTCSVS